MFVGDGKASSSKKEEREEAQGDEEHNIETMEVHFIGK